MSIPDISVEVARKVTSINAEVKSRAVRGSNALKNAELEVLRGQRGGQVYKKSSRSTSYTASSPGEPPAVRSGKLRSSFRPVSEGTSGASVTIAIKTDTHYAGYLEHGTSKMAARPYVEKIKEQALPEITQIFNAPYNV